jgi:HNH endonuclease
MVANICYHSPNVNGRYKVRYNILKEHAPKCACPDCRNLVGYHKRYLKTDGTWGAKWKTFCDYHRTVGKAHRDLFIKSRGGCENRDGRLGWTCGDPNTESLTIDHWDTNKYNNDQSNLVVLCANCHNKKSKIYKDSLQRYQYVNQRFYDLFEEVG